MKTENASFVQKLTCLRKIFLGDAMQLVIEGHPFYSGRLFAKILRNNKIYKKKRNKYVLYSK